MVDLYNVEYEPYYSGSWALVIGINRYRHARPLTYAAQDARDVAAVLVELGFPRDGVQLITDDDASKARIEESYLDYIELAASPDDRMLVFFAGHGVTMPGHHGPVGHLVPVDGVIGRPASLIRLDEFTRNADLIPAKHILLVFDACFSGLALEDKRAAQPGAQRFLRDMLQRRSRQAIAAGKGNQEVADGGGPDGKNSIFTECLLDALRGKAARDGVLTANGVMHYVYENVSQDERAEQTPSYGHIDGDGDLILLSPEGLSEADLQREITISVPTEVPQAADSQASSEASLRFIEGNNYALPGDATFGRNRYSANLGNVDFSDLWHESEASSWLAVIIAPVGPEPVTIGLADEAKRLSQYTPKGTEPYERFLPPRELMTTIDSVILFDKLRYDSQYWRQYIRIEKTGCIEFCDSFYSYFSHQGISAFRYVQTIGIVWQALFFAKLILGESGYEGGATALVNLVGTKDSILADFADQPGEKGSRWAEPGRADPLRTNTGLLDLKCPNSNLQIEYRLDMADLDPARSREVINDLAAQLGLGYNHQSEPRCFNYNTDVFPWQTFFRLRQTLS